MHDYQQNEWQAKEAPQWKETVRIQSMKPNKLILFFLLGPESSIIKFKGNKLGIIAKTCWEIIAKINIDPAYVCPPEWCMMYDDSFLA